MRETRLLGHPLGFECPPHLRRDGAEDLLTFVRICFGQEGPEVMGFSVGQG